MRDKETGMIGDSEIWRFEELYNLITSDDWYNEVKSTTFGSQGLRDQFRYDFHGISTYQQLIDLKTKPVPYKNDNVLHTNNFETVADTCGSMVNIGAYLAGEPEDMFNFVYSDSNIVKDLNLYISLPWNVQAQKIAEAAERVYKYITNKPANVYFNVNIIFCFKYKGSSKIKTLTLILSDSDSYITDHCLNMLGTPVFFRWLILNYVLTKVNGTPEPMPENKGYIDFMSFNLKDY